MTRRRTCPQGRPIYRSGEVPDHLATVTMLRLTRRRPAPDQLPAATLLYHGNKYTELYEIAGTEQLPPLPPRRQAAWTAARTCARCADTSLAPWPPRRGRRLRRLCPHCDQAEGIAAARPSWLRLRAAATAWARGVLADPDTVILAAYHHDRGGGYPLHVRAETPLTGEVLVDVVAQSHQPSIRRVLAPGAVVVDELVPHLMPLVGRRLVHAIRSHQGVYTHGGPLDELDSMSAYWWIRDPSIRQRPGDAIGQRWTDWHARPAAGTVWPGRDGLASQDLPANDAAELAAQIRVGLALMAADAHPDGPATCPWLPPTGLTACGRADIGDAGLCPDHRDATETTP